MIDILSEGIQSATSSAQPMKLAMLESLELALLDDRASKSSIWWQATLLAKIPVGIRDKVKVYVASCGEC